MEQGNAVGQYILETMIGRGGMAEVWRARHLHLGNLVAIKFLSARFAGDPELEERFLNEGKSQARLQHPNLVSATDFLQLDGRSFLVMQLIDGINLEQTIAQKGGPLELEQIHEISWDVLSVLDFAHANGVVHRDVKPSNILIDSSGHVYLTDFGIALVLTDERRITRAEMSVGTPDYMSPEQIMRPKAVDSRADIYSFGCVLYAMLTGGPPFGVEGSTEFYVKDCHVRSAPPPIRDFNKTLSPQIEAVVLKCLEKDPANRFQTCGEVMRALDAAIRGEEVQAQTAPAAKAFVAQAPGATLGRGATMTEQPAFTNSHSGNVAGVATPPPTMPPPVTPRLPVEPAAVYTPPAYVAPVTPPKKRGMGLIAALAIVALLIGGAAYAYFYMFPETALRMEGSTTVGLELAPQLVQEFLRSQGGTDIQQKNSKEKTADGKDEDIFRITARMPGKARTQLYEVTANGSGNAFTALSKGTAEVGMSSRPINEKEYRMLSAIGDFRSFACENVIGLDGIAVIVNRANPVQSLTRAQIGDIFSGKITNWSSVGGRPGEIHLFSRDKTSGTFDSFVAMVLKGNKEAVSHSAKVMANGEAIAGAVAADADGIGFVGLPQVGEAQPLAVSDGGSTIPLLPKSFTVATEDYILSRRLFLYTAPVPSPLVAKFVHFVLSDQGQQVVKKTYVPLEATLESVSAPDDAPGDYRSITAGKRRMRLTFRFRPNSDQLDTKAEADVARAVSILSNGGKVYLLGFADNKGTAPANKALSLKRAQVVAERFKQHEIQTEAFGLSSEMPVGNNNTDDGREKNRRVEVWVP
jgi:phosphate transport system substrate-binding protein